MNLKNTRWNKIKHHFSGHPDDLIEVIYNDLNTQSWNNLFIWLTDKIIHLRTQHDYINPDQLSLKSFISGELSYIATIRTKNGLELSLSIINDNTLEIDIEQSCIQSALAFNDLLESVNNIASVTGSVDYIICPEFQTGQAFVVNGKVL